MDVEAPPKKTSFIPLTLSCRGLGFNVIIKEGKLKKVTKTKQILKDINLDLKPGTLTAIMGSSGAGKTSLLNVLAGRASGKIEGSIKWNGVDISRSKEMVRDKVAYVMQDDLMLHTQTTREILDFSAKLRLPKSLSPEEKQAMVEEVIDLMHLRGCIDTKIGAAGEKRGVSGGERKRVSIAQELLTNPSLIFLDEPTSGLDSFTAEKVITVLRELAAQGRTIVCTIHQPNSQIFHLFDRLVLLAKGRLVYNGKASKATRYFRKLGYETPANHNPSDYFLNILHADVDDEEALERVNGFIQAYEQSKENHQVLEHEVKSLKLGMREQQKRAGFLTQFRLITKRSMTHNGREPMLLRAVIGQSVFLSLLIGLVFLQLDTNQAGVLSRAGVLFFVTVLTMMNSTISVVTQFPSIRRVFMREYSAHMYSIPAFYVSRLLSELPIQIIPGIIIAVVTYWMVGLQTDAAKFLEYFGFMLLTSQIGSCLGFILGTFARDSNVGVSLVPITIIPFMLFSGFLVNQDSVPVYLKWFDSISFMKKIFQSLVTNEYTDLTFTCAPAPSSACPIQTGEQYLGILGFTDVSVRDQALILVGYVLALRILGYMALWFKTKRYRVDA